MSLASQLVACEIRDPSGDDMSSGKSELPGSTKKSMEDRLVELEVENSRLQRLVAELLLKNQRLREAQFSSQGNLGNTR
jgi:hypothetical protein